MQLPEDFKEFFRLMNVNKVEYLLIGGYAVVFFGYPRTTGDIDIWINKDSLNINKVIKTLKEFGFKSDEIDSEDFWKKYTIIRMGIPPMRIEVHTEISGVDFDNCYTRKIELSYEDLHINIISLEDLKINKIASNRLKDLNDLENLK